MAVFEEEKTSKFRGLKYEGDEVPLKSVDVMRESGSEKLKAPTFAQFRTYPGSDQMSWDMSETMGRKGVRMLARARKMGDEMEAGQRQLDVRATTMNSAFYQWMGGNYDRKDCGKSN